MAWLNMNRTFTSYARRLLPSPNQLMIVRLPICSEHPQITADPSRIRAFIQRWCCLNAGRIAAKCASTLYPLRIVVHLHTGARALSSSVTQVAFYRAFRSYASFSISCSHIPRELYSITPIAVNTIFQTGTASLTAKGSVNCGKTER
jgi:hypothetical protein